MELDYYDYNVINAGAAPGSYLGMDPAYLVWIPPIDDDGVIVETDFCDGDDTSDDAEPQYDEISPDYRSACSSCTIDTPIEETAQLPSLSKHTIQSNESLRNFHNAELNKIIAATSFNDENIDKIIIKRNGRRSSSSSGSRLNSGNKSPIDMIPLKELQTKPHRFTMSPAKVHRPVRSRHNGDKDNDTEKETAVVKSPSDKISNYYQLDDIQFADEDDIEDDDNDEDVSNQTVTINDRSDNKKSINC